MIEQRIQALFREAVFKTAVQGTRCGKGGDSPDNFYCLYTNDAGQHCAVGHALTPELQELVGGTQESVLGISNAYPVVQHHLGLDHTKDYHSPHLCIWSQLQIIHDGLVDRCLKGRNYNDHRPFGVSWSAWFWYRARSLSQQCGFDIGNYPRAEVRNAQAA